MQHIQETQNFCHVNDPHDLLHFMLQATQYAPNTFYESPIQSSTFHQLEMPTIKYIPSARNAYLPVESSNLKVEQC